MECEKPAVVTKTKLEGLLCASFSASILRALLPVELAHLEASCARLRRALSSTIAALTWASSIYAKGRKSRLVLPERSLNTMTIPELKSILANMRFARGLMNGTVCIKTHEELLAISSICSQNRIVEVGSSMRVIVGRISFDKDELDFVLEDEDDDTEYEDDDEDGRFCWSNALDFYWPENGGHKGATLTAALGCCLDTCAIDIGSVLKTPKDCISLKVDVHLFHPSWPDVVTSKGIDVNVDCPCSKYALPGLDIRDADTRNALACQNGVLCLLVVHSLESTAESEALHQAAERKAAALQEPLQSGYSSWNYSHIASSLNALALSMPAYHSFR